MDPNWFYSTLAQSTAAIVGLAGGFLFTWLLSQRTNAIVERRQFIVRLHGLIDRLEQLKNRAEAVRVQTHKIVQDIHAQRAAGRVHASLAIPPFELLSHTSYPVPHPSEEDLAVLETLPGLYERLCASIVNTRQELARGLFKGEPLKAKGTSEYRTPSVTSDPFAASGIGPENFWSGLRQQQTYALWQWQEAAREYERLALVLSEFRQRLVPRSIYFLIFVLFALVGAGVVAPLFFLSAQNGSSKWILLSISAPLVVAFVGYLAYEVWSLRHAADLSRDTM